jgi:senataxin
MDSRQTVNASDDFKKELVKLRDFPVTDPDADFMNRLFTWVMARPASPDGFHWFCHRADESLAMASTFLIRLFAYDGNKKLRWLERLEMVLTGCCECVRGLQVAKWDARQTHVLCSS